MKLLTLELGDNMKLLLLGLGNKVKLALLLKLADTIKLLLLLWPFELVQTQELPLKLRFTFDTVLELADKL